MAAPGNLQMPRHNKQALTDTGLPIDPTLIREGDFLQPRAMVSANPWQVTRYVTLPLLGSTQLSIAVLRSCLLRPPSRLGYTHMTRSQSVSFSYVMWG